MRVLWLCLIVFSCVQLCVQLCKTLCIIVSTIVFATVDASPVIANLFSVRRLELWGCGVWTTWQLMCGAVCCVSSVRITMCECPLCSMQCVVYAHHSVIITLQQHSALLSSAPTVSRDRNTGQCINCRGGWQRKSSSLANCRRRIDHQGQLLLLFSSLFDLK